MKLKKRAAKGRFVVVRGEKGREKPIGWVVEGLLGANRSRRAIRSGCRRTPPWVNGA